MDDDVVVIITTTYYSEEQQELFEATFFNLCHVFYPTLLTLFARLAPFTRKQKQNYCHEISIVFGGVLGYVCHSAYFDVIATVFGC